MSRFTVPLFREVSQEKVLSYLDLVMNKWGGSVLKKYAVKDIGVWNMHSTQTITVPLKLNISLLKVTSIEVAILNDDQDEIFMFSDGSDVIKYDNTNGITLTRSSSGVFHSHDFDDATINRGIVTISYTT
tara:strand:+ start:626 stop:1015 length:390 start_codon:yes stop_codon:yes gene_type:complete